MWAVSITKTINIHNQFLSETLLDPEAMGGLFKCKTPDGNRGLDTLQRKRQSWKGGEKHGDRKIGGEPSERNVCGKDC